MFKYVFLEIVYDWNSNGVKFRCIKLAAQEEQIQVVPGEAGKIYSVILSLLYDCARTWNSQIHEYDCLKALLTAV